MPKVSVLTPVYNVKEFISKCATSLMAQTMDDVEFIFIDDKSNDGSIEILSGIIAQYPQRNVRIIHHEVNMGLPAARKTGFEASSGEYIFNCDGDDFVEPDLLELMYNAVIDNNADYAYCDFFLTYRNTERHMRCPHFNTPVDALRYGYLSGSAKYNVWNKLIRRSLYDGVKFPVEHRKGGEDMIMFDVLSKATTIAHVPKALYHYVKYNEKAISEQYSEQRLIDIKYNADNAIAAVRRNCQADLENEIAFFKLNVKLPFLISDSSEKYAIWKKWYPESNAFVLANKKISRKTRLLQYMASKDQWWFIKIYYLLVYKFIYQFLFR